MLTKKNNYSVMLDLRLSHPICKEVVSIMVSGAEVMIVVVVPGIEEVEEEEGVEVNFEVREEGTRTTT